MRQTWTLNNFHSFLYGHYDHILLIEIHDIDAFGFARKAFLSTVFLIINVYSWNETNLNTRNNLYFFCYGHNNHVFLIGIHDIDTFGFAGKALVSTIFLIINVHPWNETNLDTHYNRHSFFYRHYSHVLHIGIHDINALDCRKSFYFHHFPYN